MKNRNLDGVYFSIERDGHYESVCFSDLTENEREDVLSSKSIEWVKSLCYILADTILSVVILFDIISSAIHHK